MPDKAANDKPLIISTLTTSKTVQHLQVRHPTTTNLPDLPTSTSSSECAMETEGFAVASHKGAKKRKIKPQNVEEGHDPPPQKVMGGSKETEERGPSKIDVLPKGAVEMVKCTWDPRNEQLKQKISGDPMAEVMPSHHNHPWRYGVMAKKTFEKVKAEWPNFIKRQRSFPSMEIPGARNRTASYEKAVDSQTKSDR